MQTCIFLKMFITVKIKTGADPGFFLGGGAPVRNGARGGGGSKIKKVGVLVVSLRGVNFRFWSRLGC